MRARLGLVGAATAAAMTAATVVSVSITAAGAQQADVACDLNGDGRGDLVFSDPGAAVDVATNAGILNVRYGTVDGLPADPDETWTQDSAGTADEAEPDDQFGFAFACGDFNGDGNDDLAIGVPGQTIGGHDGAGAVHVIMGSESGLTADTDAVWHQDRGGVRSTANNGEAFGSSVTVGDFDGDGYGDLAIGVPRENVAGTTNAGAVNVLYGSADGLSAASDDFWHQNKSGVNDQVHRNDRFGTSVAAGDFDGDGRDDLAIGVPREDIDGISNAGAINVLYGSGSGLRSNGDDFWHQNAPSIKESAAADENFGLEMTVGDFERDGYDDLVVGVDTEDRKSRTDDGVVHVIPGSSSGLTGTGDQLWHQGRSGVKEKPASNDLFGEDVDANDYNGDGYDDLAIGVPGEDRNGISDMGAVNVVYGSANGLRASGDQLWHQGVAGVLSEPAASERFGIGMLTDDYDGDGRADLAIANLASGTFSFDANVLFGTSDGLATTDTLYFPFR